jgi:hypothetical protein
MAHGSAGDTVHFTFHLLMAASVWRRTAGPEEGFSRLSSETETLRNKLAELLSWERRKRREQILATLFVIPYWLRCSRCRFMGCYRKRSAVGSFRFHFSCC